MIKLTKVQRKNQERIQAWIKNEPFRESSREKEENLRVPLLSTEEVLNKYIPVYGLDRGAFYTPVEMVRYLIEHAWPGELTNRIWEPCAGIGNIVYVLKEFGFDNITATELDQESAEVFPILFPDVDFTWCDAFDKLEEYEGQFDTVVMNPPFGLTPNHYFTIKAGEVCKSGAIKSEHCFLELALRAVVPGGKIIGIAPFNWLDNIPKKMEPWFEKYVEDARNIGVLPGEFEATKIRVFGFEIWKKEVVLPVKQMPRFREMSTELPNALEVPDYVLAALADIFENGHRVAPRLDEMDSVVRSLKFLKHKDAATWISEHCKLMWGQAFFNGVKAGNAYLKLEYAK